MITNIERGRCTLKDVALPGGGAEAVSTAAYHLKNVTASHRHPD